MQRRRAHARLARGQRVGFLATAALSGAGKDLDDAEDVPPVEAGLLCKPHRQRLAHTHPTRPCHTPLPNANA
eukprot:3162744-Rhodomonas_salina.1